MNKCEVCDAPFKTLYRVKWELFLLMMVLMIVLMMRLIWNFEN